MLDLIFLYRPLISQSRQIPNHKPQLRQYRPGLRRTYQRNIVHTIHYNALVFWGIFCYSPKMCFEDVVSVEKWHFTIWFYPNLSMLTRRFSHFSCVSKINKTGEGGHTLYFAYWAKKSNAVICSLNLPLLLNFPKQVPRLTRLGLATDIASRIDDSET